VATALPAGAALAASLCLWLPYVWAVPGVLLAPFLLTRARDRLRLAGKDLGVDYAEFLATRGLLPALPLPVPRPTPDSSPGSVVAGLRPVPQDARP
jgi:hypothetical protein